jgi:hypothetical protein
VKCKQDEVRKIREAHEKALKEAQDRLLADKEAKMRNLSERLNENKKLRIKELISTGLQYPS